MTFKHTTIPIHRSPAGRDADDNSGATDTVCGFKLRILYLSWTMFFLENVPNEVRVAALSEIRQYTHPPVSEIWQ